MNGLVVCEFLTLQCAFERNVIWVGMTDTAFTNALHQRPVVAPMRFEIPHRMVGRIVNDAMLAFAVFFGVDENLLSRAGRVFFHHAR